MSQQPWTLDRCPYQAQGISGFSADVDEDYAWLNQNAFAKNPKVFPAENFGPDDFRWAVGVALSRSFFVNGELRLTPLVDFANHSSSRVVKEPTGAKLWFAFVFAIVHYVMLSLVCYTLLWIFYFTLETSESRFVPPGDRRLVSIWQSGNQRWF